MVSYNRPTTAIYPSGSRTRIIADLLLATKGSSIRRERRPPDHTNGFSRPRAGARKVPRSPPNRRLARKTLKS